MGGGKRGAAKEDVLIQVELDWKLQAGSAMWMWSWSRIVDCDADGIRKGSDESGRSVCSYCRPNRADGGRDDSGGALEKVSSMASQELRGLYCSFETVGENGK